MNFFSEVLCNFASDSSLVWNVLSGRGPYEPLWALSQHWTIQEVMNLPLDSKNSALEYRGLEDLRKCWHFVHYKKKKKNKWKSENQ